MIDVQYPRIHLLCVNKGLLFMVTSLVNLCLYLYRMYGKDQNSLRITSTDSQNDAHRRVISLYSGEKGE